MCHNDPHNHSRRTNPATAPASPNRQSTKKWTDEEVAWLKENYPQRGKRFCAKHFGVTEHVIRQKAYKLKLRQDRNSEFFKDWQRRAAESKVGKKRPEQSLVMKKLRATGKLKMTEAGRASMSRHAKARIAEKGHPRGMLGKKHTEESLLKISKASLATAKKMTKKQWRERVIKSLKTMERNGTKHMNRNKCTWKAGWRIVGGQRCYFRSRWEANYARYLQMLIEQGKIKEWKHEPKTFWFEKLKRGCVSYLPDFLVVEMDGSESYHEVKGWMCARSKTKIKRMAKYYPEVKLNVIDTKAYNAIAKTASKIIKDWE